MEEKEITAIKTPKEMSEHEFLTVLRGETELLGEVHSQMIVMSIDELLNQRFEVIDENTPTIATIQAELEKVKERNNFLEIQAQTPDHIQIHVLEETLKIQDKELEKSRELIQKMEDMKPLWLPIDFNEEHFNEGQALTELSNRLTTFLNEGKK